MGLIDAVDHSGEETGGGKNAEEDEGDDEEAELRAGKVFEVLVGGGNGEDNHNNPADHRNTKENLIAEVAPHADWCVFGGDFVVF